MRLTASAVLAVCALAIPAAAQTKGQQEILLIFFKQLK